MRDRAPQRSWRWPGSRYRDLAIGLLFSISILTSCGSDSSTPSSSARQQEAAKVAEVAFQNETKNSIRQYSVHLLKEDDSQWIYSVKGEAEFERPGFHWLVFVSKEKLQSRVVRGE
jgi:hypothetical protein